jgi:hypothetical protein
VKSGELKLVKNGKWEMGNGKWEMEKQRDMNLRFDQKAEWNESAAPCSVLLR